MRPNSRRLIVRETAVRTPKRPAAKRSDFDKIRDTRIPPMGVARNWESPCLS
jgi:hypothetical protein